MFHTTALFTPATGYERTCADIEAVERLLATTTGRFYYAGRERTRREWMAWMDLQRKALDY